MTALKTLLITFIAALSTQASASFIGSSAGCLTLGPWGTSGSGTGEFACDTASATVTSPAHEFSLLWFGISEWTVNIEAASVRIVKNNNHAFAWGAAPNEALLDLSGLDLTGLAIDTISYSGISNFDPGAAVALIGNNIHFDVSSGTSPVYWDAGSFLELNLSGGGQVPEPGSLALLGVALVGLRFTRRK